MCERIKKINFIRKSDMGCEIIEYLLDTGRKVIYNCEKECWEDPNSNTCKEVKISGKLIGFSFKMRINAIDKKLYSMHEIGKAYLEYNHVIGGEPFGYTVGMPVSADPEIYGGVAGMYNECVKRGITWEELLQWSGHSDELYIC